MLVTVISRVEVIAGIAHAYRPQAATNAAPRALQVADRWYLLHKITEVLTDALVWCPINTLHK